jgi:hypothetical protein
VFHEQFALRINAVQHLWRVDDIERRTGNGTGQRVTAVGRTVRAYVESGSDILRGQHRTYRETAAERFGAGQDIRRDAVVHVGKEIAGTPHAALNFIKYQQRLVRIAQFAQAFEEFRRCRRYAAFALNRLDHYRAGVVVHHRFYRMKVVKRYVDDIGRFRAKAIGILRLPANGYGKQRTAVEGVMEGNDFGFVRTVAG